MPHASRTMAREGVSRAEAWTSAAADHRLTPLSSPR
ncbi:hypothetical protein J2X55_001398 [Microbacterium sp. 1154]|nr:hypothetical protein [Microbacterium sp. 1154]